MQNSTNYTLFQRCIRFLPNLITLGNVFCGFNAIILSAENQPRNAALSILMGGVLDAMDGRLARYLNCTSELGLQLDSLADAFSFVVAPAVLCTLLSKQFVKDELQNHLNFYGCAFYVLAGIYRVARYNVIVSTQSKFFLGVPTPITGCFLALLVLRFNFMSFIHCIPCIMIALSILMLSTWLFPTFKGISLYYIVATISLLTVMTLFLDFGVIILGLFISYILLGLFYTFCM